MLGVGVPVVSHLILIDTPLGMVTTAPVVMEISSRMSVTSKEPLTFVIIGGARKNRIKFNLLSRNIQMYVIVV